MTMPEPNTTPYDHTQPGTVTRVVFLVAVTMICVFWWNVSAPLFTWLPFVVVMALALLCFHSLNVRLDERAVHLRFGIGLIRRSIPLETIVDATPVRNSWLAGFGIRYIGRGWMWNVSGLDAIRIDRTKGGSFFIGTDEPAALEAAINAAISKRADV